MPVQATNDKKQFEFILGAIYLRSKDRIARGAFQLHLPL